MHSILAVLFLSRAEDGCGGRTLAQGALVWLWSRSGKTIPIPGFKTAAQVEENCGALARGPLTAQ
jgi:aryl-alcohol dehydrogenase-like predicted oxidoreductase